MHNIYIYIYIHSYIHTYYVYIVYNVCQPIKLSTNWLQPWTIYRFTKYMLASYKSVFKSARVPHSRSGNTSDTNRSGACINVCHHNVIIMIYVCVCLHVLYIHIYTYHMYIYIYIYSFISDTHIYMLYTYYLFIWFTPCTI